MKWRLCVLGLGLLLAAALVAWLRWPAKSSPATQALVQAAQQTEQVARTEAVQTKAQAVVVAKREQKVIALATQIEQEEEKAPEQVKPEEVKELAAEVIDAAKQEQVFRDSVDHSFQTYDLALDQKNQAMRALEKDAARPRLTAGKAVFFGVVGVLLTIEVQHKLKK